MKTEFTIPHYDYMMTIAELLVAIEDLTEAKVIKISESEGYLTFKLEYTEPKPEPVQSDADLNLCDDCGIKVIECSDCECCGGCCDCGNW